MINKKWFYNNSEGYLGSDEEVSILFILREPQSEGQDVQNDEFWFKDVVDGKKPENRYLKILGKEASLLLSIQNRITALKKCAYINLFPKKGEAKSSCDYHKQLHDFSKGINCDNRWDIINNLPHDCCIITTQDIAAKIKAYKSKDSANAVTDCANRFRLVNYPNKQFESFSFKGLNGLTNVYSMYHPKQYRYHYSESDIQIE